MEKSVSKANSFKTTLKKITRRLEIGSSKFSLSSIFRTFFFLDSYEVTRSLLKSGASKRGKSETSFFDTIDVKKRCTQGIAHNLGLSNNFKLMLLTATLEKLQSTAVKVFVLKIIIILLELWCLFPPNHKVETNSNF